MTSIGWIGVDLDGTLAHYTEWKGSKHVGPPIPAMVERVKRWIAEGHEVRIFTARIAESNPRVAAAGQCAITNAIHEWCDEHIGMRLKVTNIKDFAMIELWDDRAVAVEPNTGVMLNPSRRGLA